MSDTLSDFSAGHGLPVGVIPHDLAFAWTMLGNFLVSYQTEFQDQAQPKIERQAEMLQTRCFSQEESRENIKELKRVLIAQRGSLQKAIDNILNLERIMHPPKVGRASYPPSPSRSQVPDSHNVRIGLERNSPSRVEQSLPLPPQTSGMSGGGPTFHLNPNPNTSTCFVFNLPVEFTNDTLRQLFSPYGAVLKTSMNCPGHFGLVEFATPEQAQAAVAALDKCRLGKGKFLAVILM